MKTWVVAAWIGLCAVLMTLLFVETYGTGQAIALALVNTAGNVFFGSYTLIMRRAQAAGEKNQALVVDLEGANYKLKEQIEGVQAMSTEALSQLRSLINELRPPQST